MKTSLDIPDKELKDVLRFTKAKTKRDAIVTAVREYNRRKHMAALVMHGRDDTVVLPGHGPTTTIGRERASNPFLEGLPAGVDADSGR